MPRLVACLILFPLACVSLPAQRSYRASGLVIAVDRPSTTVTVSHGEIAGYMEAMTMPFSVRGPLPEGLARGDMVTFTLRVDSRASSITDIKIVKFDSVERDPVAARRLKILDAATSGNITPPLKAGDKAPDFTLTDQSKRAISLSQFRGNVVALDFIYSRCPLPDYCFRLSTNFSRLQKRFRGRQDLTLLTVTFDPVHDTPQVLANYAKVWNADLSVWHFLSGDSKEVQRVCSLFGVAYWQDEGLFTHTLHTAVIDRDGRLITNMEGNRFSAQQLGDLVKEVLDRARP